MNLILLYPADFVADTSRVRITDRRLKHIQEILGPAPGDTLAVGLMSPSRTSERGRSRPDEGMMGRGRVVALTAGAIELDVVLDTPPPAKLPVVLCVALMRPIVLKRVLQAAASMGVPEIHIFHSRRVEKSFWQSTALGDEEMRGEFVLGLEQSRDTVLPEVRCHKRFKPFVEDVLPDLLGAGIKGTAGNTAGNGRQGIVADPSGEILRPGAFIHGGAVQQACVLVVGPEGGFIPYEVGKFREAGCRVVSLGERLLRVETAVVALLAKVF